MSFPVQLIISAVRMPLGAHRRGRCGLFGRSCVGLQEDIAVIPSLWGGCHLSPVFEGVQRAPPVRKMAIVGEGAGPADHRRRESLLPDGCACAPSSEKAKPEPLTSAQAPQEVVHP